MLAASKFNCFKPYGSITVAVEEVAWFCVWDSVCCCWSTCSYSCSFYSSEAPVGPNSVNAAIRDEAVFCYYLDRLPPPWLSLLFFRLPPVALSFWCAPPNPPRLAPPAPLDDEVDCCLWTILPLLPISAAETLGWWFVIFSRRLVPLEMWCADNFLPCLSDLRLPRWCWLAPWLVSLLLYCSFSCYDGLLLCY